MYLPNEIVNKILLYSSSDDIRTWKEFERMDNATFLKKQYSNVFIAAEHGNLECLKYLESIGEDVRANGDWALRLAAKNRHGRVVEYLVSIGADIDAMIADIIDSIGLDLAEVDAILGL